MKIEKSLQYVKGNHNEILEFLFGEREKPYRLAPGATSFGTVTDENEKMWFEIGKWIVLDSKGEYYCLTNDEYLSEKLLEFNQKLQGLINSSELYKLVRSSDKIPSHEFYNVIIYACLSSYVEILLKKSFMSNDVLTEEYKEQFKKDFPEILYL